jgi:GntR family transcriptional regulator
LACDVTITVDLNSAVPVYRQITDSIRALVVEGRLRPGDQLPTVRQLAVDLAVHHNTVAEAYRQLAAEGWLDLRRRRGAVVQKRERPRPSRDTTRQFEQRLRELLAVARADGLPPHEIAAILRRFSDEMKESSS